MKLAARLGSRVTALVLLETSPFYLLKQFGREDAFAEAMDLCNCIKTFGARGEWAGSERCKQCGDCVLEFTGGICPLTACSKGLINGPCGGTKDGRCEVEPEVRECGWHLIYERLKTLGQLDKMRTMPTLKDYSKMQPPKQLRSTIMWALETEEAEPVKPGS